MSMTIGLPKLQALCLRDKHLVAFFHAKGLVPHVNMRQGSVHTPAAQCVGVALGAVADFGSGVSPSMSFSGAFLVAFL